MEQPFSYQEPSYDDEKLPICQKCLNAVATKICSKCGCPLCFECFKKHICNIKEKRLPN